MRSEGSVSLFATKTCICILGAMEVGLMLGAAVAADSPNHGQSTPQATWHAGPASTPPETEVIPPPPPVPPPSNKLVLGSQQSHHQATARAMAPRSPLPSGVASGFVSSGLHAPAPASISNSPELPAGADPEAQRIRDELSRLHNDPEARRAFYDGLQRMVDSVRSGARDEELDGQRAIGPPRASWPSPASQSPATIPARPSDASPQGAAGPPRASLPASGSAIEPETYRRVVRWARANGAPVALALGVAWVESRLHSSPARGGAGEVGTFQILPARCRAEGWPARKLDEPEFNAWLGTQLLARYYREEGSYARAAAKYVAGPGVFRTHYPNDMWSYINWYASSVDSYAGYFARYQA